VFGAKLDDIMSDQKHEHPDVIIPYLLVVLRDVMVKMEGTLQFPFLACFLL
jgi:hypothetical protein